MRAHRPLNLIADFSLLFCAGVGFAEVKVPKVLSDHAVLQRDAPIHVWGWADPGEQVTVSLLSQKQTVTAGDLGKWSVYLAPEHAGGPYEITIQGTNTITISDVLIGDVWFASGQSNMQMPLGGFPGSAVLKNGEEEIANSTQPQIRLLRVHDRASNHPLPDLVDPDEIWTLCTPETAANFSAVAYFFGREIQRQEKVPIGLIDDTWGGTPARSLDQPRNHLRGRLAHAGLPRLGARWRQRQPTMKPSLQRKNARTKPPNRPIRLRQSTRGIHDMIPGRRLTSTTAWSLP